VKLDLVTYSEIVTSDNPWIVCGMILADLALQLQSKGQGVFLVRAVDMSQPCQKSTICSLMRTFLQAPQDQRLWACKAFGLLLSIRA
jgi:hypothetical protein